MPTWTHTTCTHCGADLAQATRGRPRRFCSPACKQAAYRAGVTKVNRTGYERSEGPNTHAAGAAFNPASPGQPERTVKL